MVSTEVVIKPVTLKILLDFFLKIWYSATTSGSLKHNLNRMLITLTYFNHDFKCHTIQ